MKYYSPLSFFNCLKSNKLFAYVLYTNRWQPGFDPWSLIFQHLHKTVLNLGSQKRAEVCVLLWDAAVRSFCLKDVGEVIFMASKIDSQQPDKSARQSLKVSNGKYLEVIPMRL